MEITRKKFIVGLGVALGGLAVKALIGNIPRSDTVKAAASASSVRWALAVDLTACRSSVGCSDCIAACHLAHNVPDIGNPKEEVKWLWETPYENSFPDDSQEFVNKNLKSQSVLVLCNHCDKPPCVNVCPTRATFKREDGIVMMDYHRCIGCRYCMAACPYGSRSFNWRDPRPSIKTIEPSFPTRTKGVVEKCNFCEERLAVGLSPACVEACKSNALVFGDINDENSNVRKMIDIKYTIRRKAGLGTQPQIYYVV